ncbi:MAG: kynureninase, partial [Bacteroidota bacterium]
MPFVFSLEFARQQDTRDPLSSYRNQFIFPHHNGREAIYFTGNSLGLQPQAARKALETELEDWAAHGVEGHFEARHPWYSYHELFAAPLAAVVGAKPSEVVAMNGLTVNLHLLMASFYRPEGKRTKILCEGKAFPSDQYALASQAQLHGLDPKETVVEMHPREGEHLLRTEDILETIAALGDELACIMIGGVNYYTGQYFDLAAITEAGHRVGARVGFDL